MFHEAGERIVMTHLTEAENRPVRMERPGEQNFVTTPVNIVAREGEYLIEIEVPGVDRSGLEITAENNILTVIGRRKPETTEGELCYSESPWADYRRIFELGPDVDTSKINAQLNQGVLKLHLPKAEKAKLRTIQLTE